MIDSLTLMEQQIQAKVELEKVMGDGESHLAKARYIMGQNSVSALQLPTENSNEFEAVSIVNSSENEIGLSEKSLALEVRKDSMENEHTNPIRWFGVLVPQNLHYAQTKFKQALWWAVKAANVQLQLDGVLNSISQLQLLKSKTV